MNCYHVPNSESYLSIPHSSRSVYDCTKAAKTDNAHNLQAKRSMCNTYVPLLYCLRCQLMPMARNKKWPMRLFYFHTTLNSGGFSGLVIWLLPKAGAPGAEPLAESGVVPRKLVFW